MEWVNSKSFSLRLVGLSFKIFSIHSGAKFGKCSQTSLALKNFLYSENMKNAQKVKKISPLTFTAV
jgi:hypothetical protein